jgi:DNA-3-methyladenine glycosylase
VDYSWLRLPATAIDTAARELLGWRMTANGVTVRLTEVEAYSGLGEDPASHAHRGVTARNAVMFGPAGRLYVYQIYGMHFCANVVCGEEGKAAAVLLRAGEVVDGLETARQRRPAARKDRDLAAGQLGLRPVPGAEVGGALGLDRREAGRLQRGPRIGGGRAHEQVVAPQGDAAVDRRRHRDHHAGPGS